MPFFDSHLVEKTHLHLPFRSAPFWKNYRAIVLKFSSLCISRSSCKISLPQRRLLSVKGSISFGHSMTMMVSLMRDLNTSQQHPLQFLHLLEKELRVNNGGPKCLCWNTNSTTDEFLRDCTPQRPSLLHPQVLPIFPSCHGDALLLFMYLFCCWGFLPYLLALMSGIYLMIVLTTKSGHGFTKVEPQDFRGNSLWLEFSVFAMLPRWQVTTYDTNTAPTQCSIRPVTLRGSVVLPLLP